MAKLSTGKPDTRMKSIDSGLKFHFFLRKDFRGSYHGKKFQGFEVLKVLPYEIKTVFREKMMVKFEEGLGLQPRGSAFPFPCPI
jgi:hypothetical protein